MVSEIFFGREKHFSLWKALEGSTPSGLFYKAKSIQPWEALEGSTPSGLFYKAKSIQPWEVLEGSQTLQLFIGNRRRVRRFPQQSEGLLPYTSERPGER